MNSAHLRQRLADWSFPATSFVSVIVAISRQARETERQLSTIETRVPPQFELDGLVREVRRHWRQAGDFSGLPRRMLRKLPWVLFYPSDTPSVWLGRDRRFCDEMFRMA